jgi:hypothetical protein
VVQKVGDIKESRGNNHEEMGGGFGKVEGKGTWKDLFDLFEVHKQSWEVFANYRSVQ